MHLKPKEKQSDVYSEDGKRFRTIIRYSPKLTFRFLCLVNLTLQMKTLHGVVSR